MKKALLFLASAALLFAGCKKEQVVGLESTGSGETVTVSFTAALSDGATTKASFDDDGKGVHADRCKLQVLWDGKVFYENTVTVSELEAKFENIILVKDQTYDFLFWADNTSGAYYNTDDLTAVTFSADDYVGGKDERDAFYAALNGKEVTEAFEETVTLHRPFAQLNVITTDIPDLRAQMGDNEDLFTAVVPEKVSLTVTVPTVFNVSTGMVDDTTEPEELTYIAPVYTGEYKTTENAKNTLSMDYLLAPDTEDNVVTVKFSARNETSGLADIDYTFTNIPLRRNYRTNVLGALITVKGTVNVVIEPTWTNADDETDVNGQGQEIE